MIAVVDPTSNRQTHTLQLTDGTNTLNLLLANRSGKPDPKGWQRANSPKTSLRVVSGNEGYGDFELPFSSIVQSDWSGGRGARDFEKDTTRYADALRCDTNRANEMRCGPLATQGSGYNVVYTTAAETTTRTITSIFEFITQEAGRFTAPVSGTIRSINIKLNYDTVINSVVQQTDNDHSSVVTLYIWSHNAGTNEPNAVLSKNSVAIKNGLGTQVYNFDVNASLTSGSVYWIGIDFSYGSLPAGTSVIFEYKYGVSAADRIMQWPAFTWVEEYSGQTIAVSMQTVGYGRSIIFDYRGRKLAVTQSDDMTAPKLWMQGYHGLATSNAANKSKLNTTLTISADLTGKYARIVSGPGSTEETPWRKIVSNTTGANAAITVAPNWNITHSASTEFVIQGCTSWQQITDSAGAAGTATTMKGLATYLTTPVTDVLVVDDIIYFCQGESTYIARTRLSAGVWSDMAPDGTNSGTFMELVQNDKGKRRVWLANKSTSYVFYSDKKPWGTNLVFTYSTICGDSSSQITGLLAAKIAGPMLPVVFKETEFGGVSGEEDDLIYDTYYNYPEARDDFNGRAAIQPDLYLWFSLMDGIERYYDQRLDDVGPNRDEGLPKTRKGRVSAIVKYFSHIFVAYDAGRYGYSSILRWNGVGWCEIYRGAYGRRIRSLNIDVLPDLDNSDRLWFSEEEDIYYIPIAMDPDKSDGYTYYSGSWIETAWIYGPYRDITKYWDTLAIFARNLSATKYITTEYKVDSDDNSWTTLPSVYDESPVEEHDIATLRNVTGKCIKFRLTLATNDTSISPVCTAIRVNAVIRVKPKAVWNVTAFVTDGKMDNLQGVSEDTDVKATVDRLEAWQDGTAYPAPLTARFYHTLNDQKRGFIDNVSTAPIENETLKKIVTLISFQFIEV